MKQILTLFSVALLAISVVSCSKDSTEPSTSPSTSPSSTDTLTYYIKYDDGGKTFKTKTDVPFDANTRVYLNYLAPAFISKLGTYSINKEYGWLNIVFPVDSSNINKLVLNKKYITKKIEADFNLDSAVYYIPDESIGALSYEMTFESGKDIMVDQDNSTTYYHIIKSIKYLKSEYDKASEKVKAYYVVTGEFKISVKNNATNLTRDLTNGSYKVVLGVLPK